MVNALAAECLNEGGSGVAIEVEEDLARIDDMNMWFEALSDKEITPKIENSLVPSNFHSYLQNVQAADKIDSLAISLLRIGYPPGGN